MIQAAVTRTVDIDREMTIKRDIAKIKNDFPIGMRIQDICIKLLGKEAIFAKKRRDKRRTRIPEGFKQLFKAMLNMFDVDDSLEWVWRDRFTEDGVWRETTRKEIRHSRRYYGAFSNYEIEAFLRTMERWGIIDRDHKWDAKMKKKYLFLKLNTGKLLQILTDVFSKKPVEKTMVRLVSVFMNHKLA